MTGCSLIGLGLTPFGRFPDTPLKSLAVPAIEAALADAGLDVRDIEGAFVANTVGGLISGQLAVVGQVVCAEVGLTGVPVYNVENACAGSSTALNLATHAVASGAIDAALVVGLEKLYSPDKSLTFRGINGAADVEWVKETGVDVTRDSVFMRRVYADRLTRYQERHPLDERVLAQIAVKNRRHAGGNPNAQYRDPLTIEQVLASRVVQGPIRALMCSPVADGASAAILVRGDRVRGNPRAVAVRASRISMAGGGPAGQSTIARVAAMAFKDAGIEPDDVDVAEVHDATAFGELMAYEELGFCQPGEGAKLVESGETSLGGRLPVNPSGGLESRGHPLAATGLAQVIELATQIRGEAEDRQVDGARVGVAEAAGGFVAGDSAAVSVTVLGRAES